MLGARFVRQSRQVQIVVRWPPRKTSKGGQVPLHIQDPTNPDSDYLVDVLLEACKGAKAGGGAFAFLSAGGVKLLLRDEAFGNFLRQGEFELLVGVDAITDTAAMAALASVRLDFPSIATRVFVPNHSRSIFHPKIAWFDNGDGGYLIAGSGNLTAGGLRWNIEAFSFQELDAPAMSALRAQWDGYLELTAANQLAPEDERVVALLERNAARRAAMRVAAAPKPGAAVDGEPSQHEGGAGAPNEVQQVVDDQLADQLPSIEQNTDILVAEIPRASNRWGQANFNQETFFGFFGASRTVQRRVYFFHLRGDGTLGSQEVRPTVAVQSQNYRFELEAAAGHDYPNDGRPIGVFAKIGARTFVYMLLMPRDVGHFELLTLLDRAMVAPAGKLRRIVFSAADVRNAWPGSPLWQRLTV